MSHFWDRSPIPARHNLQPERTALAWQRTALVAMLALVPPILVDARLGAWQLVVPGLLGVFVALGAVMRVLTRIRQLRDDHRRRSPWLPMLGVAVVVVLAAGGGLVTAALLLVVERG